MYDDDYYSSLGDPPEPEYPEPTLEDYCAGMGHPCDDCVEPETGNRYCRCGEVCDPLHGEPHDEYSAHCANLIDLYAEQVGSCLSRRPYQSAPESLRYDLGRELRHKTPAYLQSLTESLKASEHRLSGDMARLCESELDFYEKLGVHLTIDGSLVLQTFIARLGGDGDFIASEFRIGAPDSSGVLADRKNLEIARRAALLYIRLDSKGYGWEWRGTASEALIDVLPLITTRPDLIDAVAAVYNSQGYTDAARDRVLAMMDSDPLPVAMIDGFL